MKTLAFIVALSAVLALTAATTDRVVCYFASWTVYRNGDGKFDAPDVDPNLCTHVMYAFVGLQTNGSLKVLDDWEANGLKGIQHLIDLKQINPNLKVLVSMGGWNEGSATYSLVAADANLRAIMVQSVLAFMEQYGFDGFDLEWEYPAQRGGSPVDKDNYILLLKDLKAGLSPKGYTLSAAVAGAVPSIDISYEVPDMFKQLDFASVMAYDYHGAFDPYVGHVSPLYASHLDTTPASKLLNADAAIQYWIKQGADPQKLNLGVVTYGRTFTLQDANNAALYAPAKGGGAMGPYTLSPGLMGYNEICAFHSDMEYVWDDEQKVPHRVKGNQWYGYEDEKSLTIKVNYARVNNLGGIMIWSLDTDDFRNRCGNGTYPLLTAINKALK